MSGPTAAAPFSFRIGTAMGIPIRVHVTTLLLVVWLASVIAASGGGMATGLLFSALFLGSVVLHELGHAGVALHHGIRPREIVLYPIGGVTRFDSLPSGLTELAIAIAGPLVNLALAILFVAVNLATGEPLYVPAGLTSPSGLVPALFAANLALFVVNLIPAFPMDGGRVLRALLSMTMPEDRATYVAATVGQVLAIGLGALGLFGGAPLLAFVALFVFLGAGQEAAFHRGRAMVRGRTAREAMVTRFETLSPQDPLSRATEMLLETHQHDFPVIDAWGRVAGLLTRPALLEAVARSGADTAVLEVMAREVPVVAPDFPLDQVFQHLQQAPGLPLLVVDGGKLLGMLTLENLSELIELSRRAAR